MVYSDFEGESQTQSPFVCVDRLHHSESLVRDDIIWQHATYSETHSGALS